jgi:hypothetical protein
MDGLDQIQHAAVDVVTLEPPFFRMPLRAGDVARRTRLPRVSARVRLCRFLLGPRAFSPFRLGCSQRASPLLFGCFMHTAPGRPLGGARAVRQSALPTGLSW